MLPPKLVASALVGVLMLLPTVAGGQRPSPRINGAHPPGPVSFPGDGGGSISDGTFNCVNATTGPSIFVHFDVDGLVPPLFDVEVTIDLDHDAVGNLSVVLIAPPPDSTSHVLFRLVGSPNCADSNLDGEYTFNDTGGGTNFWTAAASTGDKEVVPPGTYRATEPGPDGTPPADETSITAAFSGLTELNGTWTLIIADWVGQDTGFVTSATLTLDAAGRQIEVTETGTGIGPIEDGIGFTCDNPGTPLDIAFDFGGLQGKVAGIEVGLDATHPWVGDLTAELVSPAGDNHVLFSAVGYLTSDLNCNGDNSNLEGLYTFNDVGRLFNFWIAASFVDAVQAVFQDAYKSTVPGPVDVFPAAETSINAAFAGTSPGGVWHLMVDDRTQQDTGTINAATLTLDVILPFFADGFESGDTSAWSLAVQ